MATINLKLKPFTTPNFIMSEMPAGLRQDGINFDRPSWPLADIDADTLSAMCDDFRAEIFLKAGKADPKADSAWWCEKCQLI